MNQNLIFLKNEGDQWFLRNKVKLLKRGVKDDWPLRLIAKHKIRPRKVLEIGCSNGWRLGEIYKRYRAECLGIEPSLRAIKDGRKNYPEVSFRRGLIDNLPIKPTEKFDLVIVAFVFAWVDRQSLFKALEEVDRSLGDGGYLIVVDLLPSQPTKVFYHHLPKEKVFTYKLDYAKMFLTSGLYKQSDRVVFHYLSFKAGKKLPPDEREVCSLLQKKSQYQLRRLK